MKKFHVPYALALLFLATGCRTNSTSEDVVSESYTHRYGVPLTANEWSDRGRQGQVASTRRDGVVVTKNYDAGQLDGECSYTYPHSNVIQKKEVYDHATLTQETLYFANGIPQQQTDYNDDGSKSLTIWFDNGSPQRHEVYSGDSLVKGEYFNPSNQVESTVQNGNGVRTTRESFGQLISNDKITNGQMIARKIYHPNGIPASLDPYSNGVVHGQKRTFAVTGEPATIETWNDNKQHGNTVVFQNGEKVSDMPYVNGVKQGVERRYREGNDVVQEVTWKDDQQHGPTYSYLGNSKHTDWYFQNKQVNKQTFDAMSNQ